ncbi:MAG: VOC family protein [Actinobacteria bacterium]|nr:VOC family protein [Actinomycetota bacterium]
MQLEGIHHITAITGDAPANVEFYVGVLGLRMVKKTVNQDDPTVYHLFYADDLGSPGADLTFFEYPGSPRGRAGAGMAHTVGWRVGSEATLDFWRARFDAEGVACETQPDGSLAFSDREGLRHVLTVYAGSDSRLSASAPDIPAEHALQGFDGVRAYSADPSASAALLTETLGFRAVEAGDPGLNGQAAENAAPGANWVVGGDKRTSYYIYDAPPAEPGQAGAGTVHHVAFATEVDEQDAWQQRVHAVNPHATPVIDRFWFKSIYFREPSGVLFELATMGPGFTADESLEELGQNLTLPPNFEHLRERLAGVLTPLPDPRSERATRA